MTQATNGIHVLDLVRIFNDPHLAISSTDQIQTLHTFLSRFQMELQGAGDAAIDIVVNLCRQIDADYDGYRDHLRAQLEVLDLIQEIRSAGDIDQARLLAELKLQLDRIEDKTDAISEDTAASAHVARKKIDPKGHYSSDEAAAILGIFKPTLHRQRAKGRLRTVSLWHATETIRSSFAKASIGLTFYRKARIRH